MRQSPHGGQESPDQRPSAARKQYTQPSAEPNKQQALVQGRRRVDPAAGHKLPERSCPSAASKAMHRVRVASGHVDSPGRGDGRGRAGRPASARQAAASFAGTAAERRAVPRRVVAERRPVVATARRRGGLGRRRRIGTPVRAPAAGRPAPRLVATALRRPRRQSPAAWRRAGRSTDRPARTAARCRA